jgi:uncharacterized protein (TIGR03492 family)
LTRVLFVSNGHGEAAIADRIAAELQAVAPGTALDHLALVGVTAADSMREVGPRRAMPSGGLIAMGNVRNMLADLRAGLLPLVAAQRGFLRSVRGSYDVAVAVGDAYALAMALHSQARTVFVGTAKSVRVAPYGPFERRLIARAASCFVRDEATAASLRERGLRVEPAANVIVDLFATADDAAADSAARGFGPVLALFPGSRASAYGDARFLLDVVAQIAAAMPEFGAVLSVAPGLDWRHFAADAGQNRWHVLHLEGGAIPFELRLAERPVVRAWTGPLGPLLKRATLVLGQAGTANEGAAAAGVPVVAFARERDGKGRWYRRRQRDLLGDALAVLTGDSSQVAAGVVEILNDPQRRRHMSETGRARMGEAGAAHRIAARIASLTSDG